MWVKSVRGGDIGVAVAGAPIEAPDALADHLLRSHLGDGLSLTVVNDDGRREVTLGSAGKAPLTRSGA